MFFMKPNKNRNVFSKAFTLTELLVIILILGVLTAIALPKYQTAVDSSRYSALMPMAKSVANAQEAYYMTTGRYATQLEFLDIQLPNNPTGHIAQIGDGTTVEISEEDDYKYVKMSKDNLQNNYVQYLNNSPNFPGEIHCEALRGSSRAEQLCIVLDGVLTDGSLTEGYDTYVLEGEGNGTPLSLALASSGPAGWQSCDSYPCTKSCSRSVSEGYTCSGTYNEDRTFTETVCQGNICTTMSYSDEGNRLTRNTCTMSGNVCTVKTTQSYDTNGNKLTERTCSANDAQGNCTAYSAGTNYSYDGNNRVTSARTCSAVAADATCSSFSSTTEYAYDNHNHVTTELKCDNSNTSINSGTGACNTYNTRTTYSYDGDDVSTKRTCKLNSSNACSSYVAKDSYNYTFEDGQLTKLRSCSSFNLSTGACNGYNNQNSYDYSYDVENNQTIAKKCNSINSSTGVCTGKYKEITIYTYDDDGKVVSERTCSGSNVTNSNTCSKYNTGTNYTYDEQGTATAQRTCTSWSGTSSCNSWGAYTYN